MSNQQLEHIEQQIAQGRFKEAQSEIELLESSGDLMVNDPLAMRHLHSTLFLKMGSLKEGKQAAEQLLEENKNVGDLLLEFNALINIIWALAYLGKIEEGLKLTRRGEKVLKIFAQTHPLR